MMNSNKRNIIETENDAQTVYCILTSSLTRKFLCALYVLYLSLLVFSLLVLFHLFYWFYFSFIYFFSYNSVPVAFALLVERTCANYVWPRTGTHSDSFIFFLLFCFENTDFFSVVHTPLVMRNSLLRIQERDTRSGLC